MNKLLRYFLLFTFCSLILPAFSQITINSGERVKIYSGSRVNVTGNAVVESGGTLQISGEMNVTGSFSHSGANSAITITSDATSDGSLIYSSGTPNVTVQRYVDKNAWHLVTPVTNSSTANDFYIEGTDAWLTYHTESTNAWTYITDLSTELYRNQGYSYWIDNAGSANTVEFTGTLTAESQTPTVTLSSSPGEGYNLLGNPFSCALDFATGSWSTTNMEGSIWIWNGTNYSYANSQSGSYSGTGTLMSNGIIPMGQGFFVKAKSNNVSITIPEDARVHNSQTFYKESIAYNGDLSHMYLGISDGGSSDGVFVSFREDATTGMDDGWDVSKLFGNEDSPQFFFVQEGRNQSINHLPLPDNNEVTSVELNFIPGITGEHVINTNSYYLEDFSVFLEDLFLNNIQDLKLNPVYVFDATKGDDPNRFLLHFNLTTIYLPDNIPGVSGIKVYSNNKDVYIRTDNILSSQSGEITLYDINGRIIYNSNFESPGITKITLDINNSFVIARVVVGSSIINEKLYIR